MKEIKNSLIDLDNGIYNIDTDRTMNLLRKIISDEYDGDIKDAILEVKDTLEIMLIWHNDNIKRLNEYYFGKNKCGNCRENTIIDDILYSVAPKQYKE